jgi:membrane protease subunit (stomatin/prohibitin family)
MGFKDFLKKQFIDILQWTEAGDDVLAWRFPTADLEIQQGGQLVVRETQAALFVHDGKAADLFGPGRHTLRTQNLPVLTNLRHWTKKFESPFKSEVYFFSTRLRLDRTWGTGTPITIRDAEFGAVRVRAFGVYSYHIASPAAFFSRVSGTRESYLAAEMEGQLRSTLVTLLGDHFAESRLPFLDMAANQVDLGAAVADRARAAFADLGLGLDTFQIQSISLPDELQKRLDERIGMGIVGQDLGRYTQYQMAQAIPVAAAQEGGVAGAGVGLGAGVAMGQAMAQAMGAATSGGGGASATTRADAGAAGGAGAAGAAGAASTASDAPVGILCGRCRARLERATRFCPECGAQLA